MDQRGVNICGRKKPEGTQVTINCEMFEECIQTMRTLKNELAVVNEAQQRGYAVETLDHSDEEADDREDQEEEELPRR